jgi:hypothetical protein
MKMTTYVVVTRKILSLVKRTCNLRRGWHFALTVFGREGEDMALVGLSPIERWFQGCVGVDNVKTEKGSAKGLPDIRTSL